MRVVLAILVGVLGLVSVLVLAFVKVVRKAVWTATKFVFRVVSWPFRFAYRIVSWPFRAISKRIPKRKSRKCLEEELLQTALFLEVSNCMAEFQQEQAHEWKKLAEERKAMFEQYKANVDVVLLEEAAS